jgi:predicted dienelactone hydrolase
MTRWVLVASLILIGCGDDGIDPLSLSVDERGPFNVGYTSWEVTYQPQGVDGPRTISVGMWYPTDDTDGYNPAYHDLFRDLDVFEDAVPAAPIHDGGYPVHVYSHGFSGFDGTSSDLMGYYASHGWVAIAPSHTDNLLFDEDPLPTSHYFTRSMDISRVLDELDTVDLAGPVANDRVVMSGHSFGTLTTWATAGATFDETEIRAHCDSGDVPSGECTEDEIDVFVAGLRDPRVVAGIPMAGGDRWWFGDTGYESVDIPMLLMTGTDDDVGAQALFDKISTVDLTWIDVEGGCHQLFGLGGCFDIEDDVGFAIVNTYALSVGRRYVLDDEDEHVVGVVSGNHDVSSLVRFERK